MTDRPQPSFESARLLQDRARDGLTLTIGYADLLARDPRLPPALSELVLGIQEGAREIQHALDGLGQLQLQNELPAAPSMGPSGTGNRPDAGRIRLTPRQREVLQLLAEGRSNADIATALGVSMNTVEFHLRSLFVSLGARSRTQALAQARSRGLLTERSLGPGAQP